MVCLALRGDRDGPGVGTRAETVRRAKDPGTRAEKGLQVPLPPDFPTLSPITCVFHKLARRIRQDAAENRRVMETQAPCRASGRPRKGLQICFQCRNRKVSSFSYFSLFFSFSRLFGIGSASDEGPFGLTRNPIQQVRCDGTAGGCENCRRLKFHCSFSVPDGLVEEVGDGSTPRADPSHLRLEKRRVRRACIACRDKKTKCCGTQPSCRRCLHRGAVCQYPDLSKPTSTTATSKPHEHSMVTITSDSVSPLVNQGPPSQRDGSIAPSPGSSLGL